MATITVLGIGNTLMGDDGVGAVVARRVRESVTDDNVEVVERPNADMGALRYFRESDRVVVIDALDVGDEAGAVYRFTPEGVGMLGLRSNNIHGMGVGQVVTNARLLGHRPNVVIYGIQVGDVRPRADELTDPVRQSATDVATMVVERELGVPSPLASPDAGSSYRGGS